MASPSHLLPRDIKTLEENVTKLESEHETLNLHFTTGEVTGFTVELLVCINCLYLTASLAAASDR